MESKQHPIKRVIKILTTAVVFVTTSQAPAYELKHALTHGHPMLQLGGFWSIQGKAQQININGAIGDYFNVSDGKGSNDMGPDVWNKTKGK